MQKKPKATQADIKQRTLEVIDLLISGHTRSDVLRHAAKEWKIASRQVDHLLALASKEIQEVTKTRIEKNLAIALRALWKDYRTCTKHQDKLGFLKQIAHLQGLGSINVNLKDHRELLEKTEEDLDQLWDSDELGDDESWNDDSDDDSEEEDN